MALTGTLIYFALQTDSSEASWTRIGMHFHAALASLAWVYLVGHASMTMINHLLKRQDIRDMWHLR